MPNQGALRPGGRRGAERNSKVIYLFLLNLQADELLIFSKGWNFIGNHVPNIGNQVGDKLDGVGQVRVVRAFVVHIVEMIFQTLENGQHGGGIGVGLFDGSFIFIFLGLF